MLDVIATLENKSVFEEDEKQTIRMFQAILSSDIDQLATLARTFTSTPLGQHDAEALMCLDCLFDDPRLIPTHSQVEVISFLELFGNYIRLLQNVIIHPAHWDSEPIKRLFCFEVAGKWTVELRKGSFLHGMYMVSTVDMGSDPISFLALQNVLGWTLAIRLRARVEKENSLCKHIVRQFDPCYYMTVHGKCKKEHEPDLPFAHNLDLAWYNRRIEAHLRQIAVVNTSHGFLQISSRNFGVHMSEKESWLARLENALNPLLYLNGSMSLLRPSMIRFPGATEAFTVVKQWAADVLDTLKPSQPKFQPMFLTFFLSASTLGLRLDERDRIRVFDRCLPRNRCVAWPRVQYPALQIHRGQDRPPRYVLHDLVNFLRSEQDFQQGATFLRVIVQKRVPVDFGPLCDLVDRLCGLFILAHSHKTQGTLHNIILPESWIMKCWDSFAHFASHNSATVDHLVKPLRSLIEGVFTGEVSQEGLDPRYRSKELSVALLRDVVLGRLCRSLCLLGCNIQDGQLKKNICNAIASLRGLTPSANHASLHRPFLNAKGWSGLAQATRLSSRDSFDKMIQLHCSNIPETNPVPLGVLRVVYSDPNTVPALLREIDLSDSQAVSESSTASRMKHVVQVNTFYAMSTEDRLRVHEEHEEAARKIQPSCRRMLHRNHTAPTKPFPAARVRFIEACLRRCHKVAGPISPYRYIYRGILPHFILCVDWALARSTQEKARAKNERANMASLDKLSAATERQVAMK
ncbi:hypothetical protein OF83DRAFT_1172069 [Amylostereum chailletii]|nr:hypothetical protein OF83DRAFT_1172069 [Amylostereum chailletii]